MTSFEMKPDGHGVILSGELDVTSSAEFEAAIASVLPIGGPATVDMRQLNFIDSSGIRTIVRLARSAPKSCIVLHGVHDQVDQVVDVTRIADMIPNLHVMPCTVGVG